METYQYNGSGSGSDDHKTSEAYPDAVEALNMQKLKNQVVGEVHRCFHCPKIFSSCHALGGHQNAHRKEKAEARKYSNAIKAKRSYYRWRSSLAGYAVQISDTLAMVGPEEHANGFPPGFNHGFAPENIFYDPDLASTELDLLTEIDNRTSSKATTRESNTRGLCGDDAGSEVNSEKLDLSLKL